MKVIAHRGAVHEALENSATAFDLAVDAGADRIELDIHLTRDRHIVVIHDDDLRRTAGINKAVADLTRADLGHLTLLNGDPIPFLDDVLERYLPQIEINIEIKGASRELAQSLSQLIKSHPLRDKLIVSSFHWEPLEVVRDTSEVAIACLIGAPLSWPVSGLNSPLNFMQHLGTRIIHPCTRLLDDNFMDQAARRGWIVYPYCELAGGEEDLNREKLWTSLAAWQVDGLCTNYPREFKTWITKNHGFQIIHKEAQQQVDNPNHPR